MDQEVLIIGYHSVGLNNWFFNVNPRVFRDQMEYLRKKYNIISLEKVIDFVEKRIKIPRKSVAITFDDGYYNIYLNAYPYFRKYELAATIFITTGYVGKKMASGNIPLKMLGWNEIKEMSENNIEIGAHTVTHRNLCSLNLEEAEDEILGSKVEIENKIGIEAKYFSYPYVKYNDEIGDLVRSLGFEGALGGSERLNRPGDNPFILNRVFADGLTFLMTQLTKRIGPLTFLMFKARLKSLF